MPEEEETVTILFQCEDISSESMVNKMREDIMSQMTRPEDGERCSEVSHRRGGMERDCYRRPPEGLLKALERVESMRDKGAKRAASWKLHIDDGCMGGGEAVDYKPMISGEEPYRDDPNYHDISRRHIWHYCVFCDEQGMGGPGAGWPGGLSFVVAAGVSNNIVKTFMHELGHNILGGSSADYGKHRDSSGHCDKDTCAMWYRSKSGCHDYCSECWNDVDLVQCDSGYSGGP